MKLQKRKLKNGIIVIHEQRDLPLIALSITNPFGASFEESKIKGIAHVIEHLVFTGTKNRTHEDISREIEKKGGILNAFTSHDMTSFWFKLPSKHIFKGLDILTDILNNSTFDEEKFEKEKKVIIEELKMYHDSPMHDVSDKIEANLYGKPFGENVGGSIKTVSSLTRNFVKEFFEKAYNPKNFIVTLVGKADLNKVCEYLEKNFKPKTTQLSPKKINFINKETTEERSGIDQAHFILAFHAPQLTSPEHAVLSVLDAYIAKGMSSRLFLEIREKRGLAYIVRSGLATEKNFSYYSVYVGTTKKAVPEVKKLIIQEFNEIDKMTEKDLAEAKEMLIGLKKVGSEESSDVMNALMYHELIDKAENYYTYENKIQTVTIDQVKKISKSLIKEFSTAAIIPK